MGDAEDRQPGSASDGTGSTSFVERSRAKLGLATARARQAGDRHVSVAVPFRAAERNRRVAASVLAGGAAYRIFLWLLPFGLIVGGALGLGDADDIEDALSQGGVPAGIVEAVGEVATASNGSTWWLLALGVPLLLWAGYTGAKAMQLIHALVWDEAPPRTAPLKSSLAFTGICCACLALIAVSWWVRDASGLVELGVAIVMIAPLAGLWLWASLLLPHGNASWKRLVPGALLVAVGFQVLHALVINLVVPKLEKSTSHYGGLGVIATVLFFMYFAGRLVVTAPILNSSLHEEIRRQDPTGAEDEQSSAPTPSPG